MLEIKKIVEKFFFCENEKWNYPRFLEDFHYHGTMNVPCISEKMSIRNWVTFCGWSICHVWSQILPRYLDSSATLSIQVQHCKHFLCQKYNTVFTVPMHFLHQYASESQWLYCTFPALWLLCICSELHISMEWQVQPVLPKFKNYNC